MSDCSVGSAGMLFVVEATTSLPSALAVCECLRKQGNKPPREQKGDRSSGGSSVPCRPKARIHGLKHLGWTSVRLDPQFLKLKRVSVSREAGRLPCRVLNPSLSLHAHSEIGIQHSFHRSMILPVVARSL